MNPLLRNILAVIAGLIIGGLVNMGLISLGPSIIPPPEGMDPSDMESLKEFMPQMEFRHFIFPFLAHALGTLVGAFTAAKLAISKHMSLGLIVGAFFLIGGIMMVVQLPSPMWFNIVDLVGAYFPMGYLGAKLAMGAVKT
ncbi:MAG: hypothetical protein R8P61_13560 [Bacteroidia bacterium]|nr:hypothetical protein [Bacteroidia bacterium]